MIATTQNNFSTVGRAYRRVFTAGVCAVFVLGAVGVGVAYATTRPVASLAPGTARLVPGDAAVTVHRASPTAAANAPLRSGDSLTVTRGVAIVQTPSGRLLARPGTTLAFDGVSPRLVRGDVLVNATGPFQLVTQASRVTVKGIARVHQLLSLEVGVYKGEAKVATAGDSRVVPALRRAVIAGQSGSTLGSTTPLSLDPSDSWDRRLMGVALELDAALSSRSRGITLQVANSTAEVRTQVLSAARQWNGLTALAAEMPVGEAVVAAEVAKAGQLDETGLRNALALRSEGASWGLIAIAQGIKAIPTEIPGIDAAVVAFVNNVANALLDPQTVIVTPAPSNVPITAPTSTVAPTTSGTTQTNAPDGSLPQDSSPVVVAPIGAAVRGVGSVLSGLLGS